MLRKFGCAKNFFICCAPAFNQPIFQFSKVGATQYRMHTSHTRKKNRLGHINSSQKREVGQTQRDVLEVIHSFVVIVHVNLFFALLTSLPLSHFVCFCVSRSQSAGFGVDQINTVWQKKKKEKKSAAQFRMEVASLLHEFFGGNDELLETWKAPLTIYNN